MRSLPSLNVPGGWGGVVLGVDDDGVDQRPAGYTVLGEPIHERAGEEVGEELLGAGDDAAVIDKEAVPKDEGDLWRVDDALVIGLDAARESVTGGVGTVTGTAPIDGLDEWVCAEELRGMETLLKAALLESDECRNQALTTDV